MNKIAIAVAALAFSASANAVDVELGTGINVYGHQHNGVWYQEGFPYDLELHTKPMSFGVSEKFGNLRYRAEFLYLGNAYSNSVATTDANYTPNYPLTCGNDCQLFKFIGRGSVSGVVLSAVREETIFSVPIYVEAGAYFYRPKWQITVTEAHPEDKPVLIEVAHDPNLQVGPVIGFGIRGKGLDIGMRYIYVEASGDEYPAIYTSAYTLMVKVYF